MSDLSHLDAEGRARMVDVAEKPITRRECVARGAVRMLPETLARIAEGRIAKGDVLATARLAAIQAAKRTDEWIPLCHSLPLDAVEVELTPQPEQSRLAIQATTRAHARTGVEMEALVAVAAAGLAIYDMCKAVDRGMVVEAIHLVRKSGGKSGRWERGDDPLETRVRAPGVSEGRLRERSGHAEPAAATRCPNPRMSSLSAGAELVEVLSSTREPVAFEASEDPDAELVSRWQAGDALAFERLVRAHERSVFRLLYRMLGSREEAEDASQETFLSLHRHGHRFRRESRFSTFLYRVAANAALNRRRSLGRARNRERELSLRQSVGAHLPSAPRNPEESTHGIEVQGQVQAALLELPHELRVAVVLYDIEGQSYKEIAEILDIPEGTVKSRIHRARHGLRELLKPLVQPSPKGEMP